MSTTTPQFGPDFVKELVPWMLERIGEETAKAFRMFWDIGMTYLLEHWVAVISFLFAVLVYAIIRALMGHWWILGSVLYNYFYFGTLFLIGLIFGPEIFANDYFKIVLFLVYITCYILVGKILKKTGLRRI
jgi:hypothetical protein